jgi:hypothetical protein
MAQCTRGYWAFAVPVAKEADVDASGVELEANVLKLVCGDDAPVADAPLGLRPRLAPVGAARGLLRPVGVGVPGWLAAAPLLNV